MVITMAKLRMAHASTHGARKPPGPIFLSVSFKIYLKLVEYLKYPAVCLSKWVPKLHSNPGLSPFLLNCKVPLILTKFLSDNFLYILAPRFSPLPTPTSASCQADSLVTLLSPQLMEPLPVPLLVLMFPARVAVSLGVRGAWIL